MPEAGWAGGRMKNFWDKMRSLALLKNVRMFTALEIACVPRT